MALGMLALLCQSANSAEKNKPREITYLDLIKRLTDLESLAISAEPGEKAGQWSSYNRTRRYDEATGKYVNWDNNFDSSGYIRKEGDDQVLAEMEGPGAIVRMWMAQPEGGDIKIYIDDLEKPAIVIPAYKLFDNSTPPFLGSALSYTAGAGWNCFVPVPYQKFCKITGQTPTKGYEKKGVKAGPNMSHEKELGWGGYFTFGYITYPKGTIVPKFNGQLSAEEKKALEEANRILENCGADPAGVRKEQKTEEVSVQVKPGQTVKIMELTGPRAITAFKAQVDLAVIEPKSPEYLARLSNNPIQPDVRILRELCLRMTWDNAQQPQVWSPLGDFFGGAPGLNQYKTLPLGVIGQELYSYWYMPFAEKGVLEITNDGVETRSLKFRITHAPLPQPIGQYARFHAKWHRDAFLPDPDTGREVDWTLLTTKGRGRFVGVMLHVWNPRAVWWGEGNESFFVDGEKMPSFMGTGSEDFFGYGFCSGEQFRRPYHSQPCSLAPKVACVNRWFISDSVPFQTGFEGALQKYYHNDRPTRYAATAYWYLMPGGEDAYGVVPFEDRLSYMVIPSQPNSQGIYEAEWLTVTSRARNERCGKEWSSEYHVRSESSSVGDKLEIELPVAKPGKYKLEVQFTKGPHYGVVQAYLNGTKIGNPVDTYAPDDPKIQIPYKVDVRGAGLGGMYFKTIAPSGPVDFGVLDFTSKNVLSFEITDVNPGLLEILNKGMEKIKAYSGDRPVKRDRGNFPVVVGVDYIKLTPAP